MLKKLLITLLVLGLLAGAALLAGPRAGAWYLEQRLLPRVARGLKRTLTVDRISVDLGQVRLERLTLRSPHDGPAAPMLQASQVLLRYRPWELLHGRLRASQVEVTGAQLALVRGPGGQSNFMDLLQPRGDGAGAGQISLDRLTLRSGTLQLKDSELGLSARAESISGAFRSGQAAVLKLDAVTVNSSRRGQRVSFASVKLRLPPGQRARPEVQLSGGRLPLLPRLVLTGIQGTLKPVAGGQSRLQIALRGGYGGAPAQLWSAAGSVDLDARRGSLQMEASRFSLGRISSLLQRTPLILPQKTSVDGRLKLTLSGSRLEFSGKLSVQSLNLFHPALARTPVLDISADIATRGELDWKQDRLSLAQLTLSSRGVTAELAGTLTRWSGRPRLEARLRVPPVPCQKVLEAIPASLVPRLRGFRLRGSFSVDMASEIDFRQLDELKLGGKLGIDRCQVVSAPEAASARRLKASFEHQVEIEPGVDRVYIVGPEYSGFVPFNEVAPIMVQVLLTTEDAGFFRHRGFIVSQFRKALARNLERGRFRLGASTISMQMVKNVLLNHDKTLSRKLQELFLTWFLEQHLSKQRIMEIYLNVIELGPGIYGIGPAARHYFGKHPRDLNPLEAAFFATLLPSPKRRYVQYCSGKLSPRWESYVRRVLRRMAAKGYLGKLDLASAEAHQVVFIRDTEVLTEDDCKARVSNLVESWKAEHRGRLRSAVLRYAPHQIRMYLPK